MNKRAGIAEMLGKTDKVIACLVAVYPFTLLPPIPSFPAHRVGSDRLISGEVGLPLVSGDNLQLFFFFFLTQEEEIACRSKESRFRKLRI